MFNFKYIKYTWEHKKAFLKVEKQLLGRNTLRGYIHDVDKLFLYPFLKKEIVTKIHRELSKHHLRANCKKDYIQQIIDWESSSLTKKDKPLNARSFINKTKMDKKHIYFLLLEELGL